MMNQRQILLLLLLCFSGCEFVRTMQTKTSPDVVVTGTVVTGNKLKAIISPQVLTFGAKGMISLSGGVGPYTGEVISASGTFVQRTTSTSIFDYTAPIYSENSKMKFMDSSGLELEVEIPVTKTGSLTNSMMVQVTPGNEFTPDDDVVVEVSNVQWTSTAAFVPECKVPGSQGAMENSVNVGGNIVPLGSPTEGTYLFKVTPAAYSFLRECKFTDQRSDTGYIPLRTVPADLQEKCDSIVVQERADVLDQVSTRNNPSGGPAVGPLRDVHAEVILLNGRKVCSIPVSTGSYSAYVGDGLNTNLQFLCPPGWYRYDYIGSNGQMSPVTITAPRKIQNATDGWGATGQVTTNSHASFAPGGIESRDTCLARNMLGDCSSSKTFYAFLRRVACYR